jgi:hypothetical protein
MVDKLHKPSTPECNILSSELFIICLLLCLFTTIPLCGSQKFEFVQEICHSLKDFNLQVDSFSLFWKSFNVSVCIRSCALNSDSPFCPNHIGFVN